MISDRRRVGAGLGLALRRQRRLLTRVAGLALGLGLDEPALLHLGQSGGRDEHEAKQEGARIFKTGSPFAAAFPIPQDEGNAFRRCLSPLTHSQDAPRGA